MQDKRHQSPEKGDKEESPKKTKEVDLREKGGRKSMEEGAVTRESHQRFQEGYRIEPYEGKSYPKPEEKLKTWGSLFHHSFEEGYRTEPYEGKSDPKPEE